VSACIQAPTRGEYVKKEDLFRVAVSLSIAIAVFVVMAIVFQWSLAFAAILSVCFYVGLSFLLAPVFKLGGVNIDTIKNGQEIMALVEEGEKNLNSVKTTGDKSKNPRIKEKAHAVYREGQKIITFVKKNPHKAMLARRFFNYYLDKANEILSKYSNLSAVEIETERLTALREKTINVLESITKGMVSQFSRLISSEVIDIEADIKLLETTIKMEDSR
jgi:hypothetical protein